MRMTQPLSDGTIAYAFAKNVSLATGSIAVDLSRD